MLERRLEQHRQQHLHLRRLLLRLRILVSKDNRGTNVANTFRDKLSSVWREQVECCIVARGYEFVVDEQLRLDWASHFVRQSFSDVNKVSNARRTRGRVAVYKNSTLTEIAT
jgi:hypothetical protein